MIHVTPLALVLLLTIAAAATGQAPAAVDPNPSLTVTGQATVAAQPDRAIVHLGASTQAEQATTAHQQINQVMARAIDAIRQAGIDEKSIQTSGLTLHPVYHQAEPPRPMQQQPDQTPRIVGYRASNTVRVIVDDVANVGRIIDAGIGAGANQLEGISFELKDDTQQRADALSQAAANAQRKAETLAQATGVQLREKREIMEAGVHVVPPPMYRSTRMAVMDAGTPVQPGQVQVEASVSIRYRVE